MKTRWQQRFAWLALVLLLPVPQTATAQEEEWIFCATAKLYCEFEGTTEVRFGANGVYVTQTHTDGVLCSPRVFGDPLPGVKKSCVYKEIPVPLSLESPGDQTGYLTIASDLTLSSEGNIGDKTFVASGLPDGLQIDAVTGTISGIPLTLGTFSVQVTVSTAFGESATVEFNWLIEAQPSGSPPVVTTITERSGNLFDTVNLQVQATDPDGDPLTFEAEGLPEGLSIDATTGVISGILAQEDFYSVTLIVSDGTGFFTPFQFEWQVNDPSWLFCANPRELCEFEGRTEVRFGAQGEYSVQTREDQVYCSVSVFGDPLPGVPKVCEYKQITIPLNITPPGDQLGYVDQSLLIELDYAGNQGVISFTVNGLPPGLDLDGDTGAISGVPTTPGIYLVAIDASSTSGEQASISFTLEILPSPIGEIPTITFIEDQSGVVGDIVTLQIQVTDADSNSFSFFTQGLPDGLSVNPSTGLISGTLESEAFTQVSVTVTDESGNEALSTFQWQVSDPTWVFCANARQMCTFEGQARVRFGAEGTYNIQTRTDQVYCSASVFGDPLPRVPKTCEYKLLPVALGVTPPEDQSGFVDQVIELQIVAQGNLGELTYSAIGLPPGLNIGPQSGLIEGQLTQQGLFEVTVTVSSTSGEQRDISFTWLVSRADGVFRCPQEGLYFCDDFEDGTYTNWEALIDGKGLADPGVFDVMEQDGSHYLRFTAGTRGPLTTDGEVLLVKESAFSNVTSADYFVEYRIRPRANGNSGNKYLFGMGRYQGPLQWYLAGLNVQDDATISQVEAGVANGTSLERPLQVPTPIGMGDLNGSDGPWYIVRFELVGNQITLYLDGKLMGSYTDTAFRYSSPGLIGFFTYNRSFELDYVQVGDPAIRPVQLDVDYPEDNWASAAGDEALTLDVSAIQSDGVSSDTFTVISSDERVAQVTVVGSRVMVEPLSAGAATITIISDSNPFLSYSLNINVAEPTWIFCASARLYCEFEGTTEVRFGADGEYFVQTHTDGVDCTSAVFGDPARGIRKSCEYRQISVPLTLSTPPSQLGYIGQFSSLQLTSGGNLGVKAFAASGLPSGLILDPDSGLIEGTPQEVGVFVVDIDVSNSLNEHQSGQFVWQINAAPSGSAPQIIPTGSQTGEVGDMVTLAVVADDLDGDALTYSATGLPASLSIEPASGLITGFLGKEGTFEVEITVIDGTGFSTTDTFNWVVTDPSWVFCANAREMCYFEGTTQVRFGAQGEFAVQTRTDQVYCSSSVFGDPLRGVPKTCEYKVILTPLSLSAVADQSGTVGDTVSLTIAAQGSDQQKTFSARGLPDGLSIDTTSGLISGELLSEGDFSVTVEVTNSRAEFAALSFNWSVSPALSNAFHCPVSGLYFCDDFESGSLDNWQLLIDEKGLLDPGVVDLLVEDSGTSLRFTAATRGDLISDGEVILVKPEVFSQVPPDYYVEFRIRPRDNGNSGNKYLFAMGRYQGPLQWYLGGMNMQSTTTSTQAEAGFADGGSVQRPVQALYPFVLGSRDSTDGQWYNVRFDMAGNQITLYVDGEQISSFTDEAQRYSLPGLIGFYTYNRSFEVDYVKVGDPAVKPVQLRIDYAEPSWTAAVGDPDLAIEVTAIQSDGLTTDNFTATSSDETVALAVVSGTQVYVTPLSPGSATITIASGSDPGVMRQVEIEVVESFVMSTTDYGDISALVSPTIGAGEQAPDVQLSLIFDAPPQLGSVGSVRIFRASDDAEVDDIRIHNQSDELGYAGQSRVRILNTAPIRVEGNTLHISPHSNALTYGTEYYVAIGNGVVSNAQLNGVDFDGLGEVANWHFTVTANPPTGAVVIVDDNGPADFNTVQGALNYMMSSVAKDDTAVIQIRDGVYNGPLFLRDKNNLTLQGESRNGTIIRYENFEGLNSGSGKSSASGGSPEGGRSLFLVEGTDMLTLENLTLHNSHRRSGSNDQAETIYFNSSYRLVAKNSAFISEQDTLLLKGYTWFYDSLVAGNVDFIWGYSVASLFENSEIRSLGDSKPGGESSGGYVLQARVEQAGDPGFVFLNSTLTHAAGPAGNDIPDGATYLARSGGSSSNYDNIVFINCRMDSHVASIGWAGEGINGQPAPNPATADAAGGWREFGSMDIDGNPLDLSLRSGGYVLSDSEALQYSDRNSVFAGYNGGTGWAPEP